MIGGEHMNNRREWLIGLRIQSGLTHQEVADLAEIDRSYYTQIENGNRNPRVPTAQKIAEALKFEWTLFFNQKCGMKPRKNTA